MAEISANFLNTNIKGTLDVANEISTQTLKLNNKNVVFDPTEQVDTLISVNGTDAQAITGKAEQLVSVKQAIDIINSGDDAKPEITFDMISGMDSPKGSITLSSSDTSSGIYIHPLLKSSGYGSLNSSAIEAYNKTVSGDTRVKQYYLTGFSLESGKSLTAINSGTLTLTTNTGLINIGANASGTSGIINFGNTSKQILKGTDSPVLYIDANNCSANTIFDVVYEWDENEVSKKFSIRPKDKSVTIGSGNTISTLNLNGGTISNLNTDSSGGSINTITTSDGTLQISKLIGRMDLINVGDANNTSKLNVDYLYGLMKITGVRPTSSVGITVLSGSASIDGGNGTINIKDNAFTGTINLYKEAQSSSQVLPVTISNNEISLEIGSSMVTITDGTTHRNKIKTATFNSDFYTTDNTNYGTLGANSGWIDTAYSIKAAAVGTTVVNGSGAVFKPVLTTVSTQSGGTERNINNISGAIGSSTPNKPDSGFYYAVKSASDNDKTISFSPRISTAGWIQNGAISSAEASGTISLTDSDTLYVPVTSGSVTLSGGTNASHTITGGTVTAPQNFTCSSSVEPDTHWAPVIETTGNPSGIPIDIYSSAQYSDISVSAISATSTYNPVSIAKTIGFITGGNSSYSIPSSTANKAASTISGRSISDNKTIWLTGFTIPASSSFNISSIANMGVLKIDDVISGGEVRIGSVSGGTVYIGDTDSDNTAKLGYVVIDGILGDVNYTGSQDTFKLGIDCSNMYHTGIEMTLGDVSDSNIKIGTKGHLINSSIILKDKDYSDFVIDTFEYKNHITGYYDTMHMTGNGTRVQIDTLATDTTGSTFVNNEYSTSYDQMVLSNYGKATVEAKEDSSLHLVDGGVVWTITNSNGTIIFE